MLQKPTLWLRSEHKPNEARTPITPSTAQALLNAGYSLVVEHSKARAFANDEYAAVGCTLSEEHSWQQAPTDAIVIGLKELSTHLGPFVHRHVHFAHVYKQQDGWQEFLRQFSLGGGTLYDLEYLVDEQGRRVAAFGYWAGFVGAAVALLQYVAQQTGSNLGPLVPWVSREQLQSHVSQALQSLPRHRPSALVIGAKGRSGGGAVDLFKRCSISVTEWDQQETAVGGPFDAVLEHELLVNCVFLDSPVPAFTTTQHLSNPNRILSVISDVSCDPFSDANPLPIYNVCTTMLEPSVRIIDNNDHHLDLISIDHLPSLLPIESSNEFADALLPHLLGIDQLNQGVWQRAESMFKHKNTQVVTGEKV